MTFLNNQWVVTIVGGLIVYFLTRGGQSNQKSSALTVDTLLGLLLFLLLQTGIPILEKSIFKSIVEEQGKAFYLFLYEILAIIIVVVAINRRRQNRD